MFGSLDSENDSQDIAVPSDLPRGDKSKIKSPTSRKNREKWGTPLLSTGSYLGLHFAASLGPATASRRRANRSASTRRVMPHLMLSGFRNVLTTLSISTTRLASIGEA